MINIFQKLDIETYDLLNSLNTAGYKNPTILLNYDGTTRDDIESPFSYYLGKEKGRKRGRYFNEIVVPHYSEIKGNNRAAEIYDEDIKTADVVYFNPKHRRIVKEVKWLDTKGRVRSIDHYNDYGRKFAETIVNADGQKVIKTYFDTEGKEKIIENFVTKDITLYEGTKIKNFSNLQDFTINYIYERGYNLDRIFYNSLSTPFFITLKLKQKEKNGNVLFWQEPINGSIPGNMNIILNENRSNTGKIVMQSKVAYANAKVLWPKDKLNMLEYLGNIYIHPRMNNMRKEALILTNSDQIVHLKEIVEALPDVKFNIGAITEMSDKLMKFGRYKNVSLYPNIETKDTRKLVENSDIYLDINRANEILDAIRGAFENNMLIVGFDTMEHDKKFIAPENTYAENQVDMMIDKIKEALADSDKMEEYIGYQRTFAGDETVERYQKIVD